MTNAEIVVLCSELENAEMTRRDVTQKDNARSCNTCPECDAVLVGKHKTCSVKCRVALHRRLARQGTPDRAGAVLSVARRVLAKDLERDKLDARRRLREIHKEKRETLRQTYLVESEAMRNEIAASDLAIDLRHQQRMLEQSEAGTLGITIAKHDKEGKQPQNIEALTQ